MQTKFTGNPIAQAINNGVSSHQSSNTIPSGTGFLHDPSGDLGYGIGRLLRGTFDSTWAAWQQWWNPVPSLETIALERQQQIYRQGLQECIQRLEFGIENLRKNPNDPASLRKVDELSQHYAAYVNVAPAMELNVVQQQLFQPIVEQIERFSDPVLKQQLKYLLPVLEDLLPVYLNTLENKNDKDDTYSSDLIKSYYEESHSDSKDKRAIQQQPFPAVFDLSNLNGANGFTVPGVASNGQLGTSVSTAGDINGDNITDLVLGANGVNSYNGTAYVIFGSRNGFGSSVNLANLNGANGFTVPGIASSGYLGASVSTASDINGDNITDLILGAPVANSNNGMAYVIFGSRNGFGSSVNLANLNGANGFTVPGIAAGGHLGNSVSVAGDINGDNISDLVLGAPFANSNNGTAYVIFGSRNGFGSSVNLTNLNGANGFTVPGIAAGGYLGNFVGTAGDINGDGFSDLVLGAPAVNSFNGTAYVIFGSRGGFSSPFNLSNLNGANGFTVPGIAAGGWLGVSVSTAGDINGDNITDLVLGAPVANSFAGTAYAIFGSRNGFGSSVNLTNLNGANGFSVPGIASNGKLGNSVSVAGDINGDNISDLVLGAPFANSNNGTAYVIFGSRNGFGSSVNLTNLNGANGFTVPGIAAGGYLGNFVGTAGDINGDGFSDLVLGAPAVNSFNGTAYVIFGQNTVSSLTPTPIPTPMASTTSSTSTTSSSSTTTAKTPTPSPLTSSTSRLEPPFWLLPIKFLSASHTFFNTLLGFEKESLSMERRQPKEKETQTRTRYAKTFFSLPHSQLGASTNVSQPDFFRPLPRPNRPSF